MSDFGTGDAPDMNQLKFDRSTSPTWSLTSSMNWSMAGTSRPVVSRSSDMSCQTLAGSKSRITIWVTPE